MQKMLSSAQIADLCYELSLVLQAGLSLSDGMNLIAEGERDAQLRQKLSAMGEMLALGESLSVVLGASELFPPYVVQMCAVGEQTGRTDRALAALAAFYTRRATVSKTLRRAVVYPSLLAVVMLAVIALLATKVMPIFADVFARLGGTMSPIASAVLSFGEWLQTWWPLPTAVLVLLVAMAIICCKSPRLRSKFAEFGASRRIFRTIASARFASVMAMAMASGLTAEDGLKLAESVADNRKLREKIAVCRASCENGRNFGEAVGECGLLRPMDAQLLAIGLRTGNGDTVMEEIARRGEQAVADETDALLARVEPTIVIILAAVVGLILVSVMLPLLSVLTTL